MCIITAYELSDCFTAGDSIDQGEVISHLYVEYSMILIL
jgi:hypothetical protein